MRTYEEALVASRPERSFGYLEELDAWMVNWCQRCKHDQDQTLGGCPLLMVAIVDERTPSEWMEGEPQKQDKNYCYAKAYSCIEFRDKDDKDGGEPTPIPTPPGQDGLFERSEFEGRRVLKPLPEHQQALA